MNWQPAIRFAMKWGQTLEALAAQHSGGNSDVLIDVVAANAEVLKKYAPQHGPMIDDAVATLREMTAPGG